MRPSVPSTEVALSVKVNTLLAGRQSNTLPAGRQSKHTPCGHQGERTFSADPSLIDRNSKSYRARRGGPHPFGAEWKLPFHVFGRKIGCVDTNSFDRLT